MAVGEASGNYNARVILVAQEIEFAKVLAGNDKTLRIKGIKKLRRWLAIRSRGNFEFTDDDFLRIWKGLYYCMWMADKLLMQEELAERISDLVHCFRKADQAVSFIQGFFQTMVLEWFCIDLLRYDKFMMLVRRFLRRTFQLCYNHNWEKKVVNSVCNVFSKTILSTKEGTNVAPMSLVAHFSEIYLQELAKVGREKIPVEMVTAFLRPFIKYLADQENYALRDRIVQDVFLNLIEQSDIAMESHANWEAWKAAGFPGNSWREMECIEEDQEEEEEEEDEEGEENVGEEFESSEREMLEGPLDPRAGHVDVELPQIPFDSHKIAEALREQSNKCSDKKLKRSINHLARKFSQLADGKYSNPKFKKPEVLKFNKYKWKKLVHKAAQNLYSFESGVKQRKRRKKTQKSLGKGKMNESVKVNVTEESSVEESSEKLPKCKPVEIAVPLRTSEDKVIDRVSPQNGIEKPSHVTKKRKNRGSSLEDTVVAPKLKMIKKDILEAMDERVKVNITEESSVEESSEKSPKSKPVEIAVPLKTSKDKVIDRVSPQNGIENPSHVTKRKNRGSSMEDTVVAPELKMIKKDILNAMDRKHKVSEKTKQNELSIVSTTPKRVKKMKVSGDWEVSDNGDATVKNENTQESLKSPAEDKKLNVKSQAEISGVPGRGKKGIISLIPGNTKADTPMSNKKVNIALSKNCAQDLRQYRMSVKRSPAIPFDASKQPSQGVLKPSPVGSRINPFYRLRQKKRLSR